ncbi:MAG: twin-arginine translocation protein, TatA/E family subunit [Deltaproteobacteria bacterium]|nr:twin-arginine translocation protein, TatA/E family subunit [Deltaproteobacteria bacterium]
MFGLGTTELLVILAVVFFFFGAKKIPELSRGLGRAVRNFKKGLHEPDAIDVTPKKEEKRLDEKKEIQK